MRKRWERSAEKEAFWKRMVSEWEAGKLSVRQFCKQNDISEHSFYGWRREVRLRVREVEQASSEPVFLPLTLKAHTEASCTNTHPSNSIEIIVGSHTIRLMPGFDSETLGRVLAVIANSSKVSA